MKKISENTLNRFLKAFAFSALLILASKQNIAQMCTSPGSVIYALSNSGNIYPVTVSSGSVGAVVNPTSLGSTGSANAIGYNTVNGIFYYFQNANNGGWKKLVSYNHATN